MVAAMIARHFNTTNVYALFCFGHERRLALTALADAVVTIGAGIVLIGALGMIGGPLAALVAVLIVSVPLNLNALAVETGVGRTALVATLAPWALRFVLVAGAVGGAAIFIRPATFLALGVTVLIVGTMYAAAVAGPVLHSPAGIYLQPLLASAGRRLTPARLRPRWLS
jgi:hypothetical protein